MSLVFSLQLIFIAVVFGSQVNQPSLPGQRKLGNVSLQLGYANSVANKYFSEVPTLKYSIRINGSSHALVSNASMDTGSMSFGIALPLLNITEKYAKRFRNASECLSSSGRVWKGYWIDADQVDLTFHTGNDDSSNITSNVPIFAVASVCNCSKSAYPPCTGICTCCPANRTNYLGVGYGRHSSEQPDALLNKNALANIAAINGVPVGSDFHPGYVLTRNGVEIGLTHSNTAEFRKTKLRANFSTGSQPEWNAVNVTIRVNGTQWNHGTGLFDTGIDDSYIKLTQKSMNESGMPDGGTLGNGSIVELAVGHLDHPIGFYNVTVGTHDADAATAYNLEHVPALPHQSFMNTGRHFYRKFDAMLDIQDGYFGLRPHKYQSDYPVSPSAGHSGWPGHDGDSDRGGLNEYNLQQPIIHFPESTMPRMAGTGRERRKEKGEQGNLCTQVELRPGRG